MPFYRLRLYAIRSITSRHIIVAQAAWIKPVFERRDRAVVLKRPAIPHAFKHRHFVVAGAAPSAQRRRCIGVHRPLLNVVFLPMVVRDCESIRRSQLVAGVKRRCMATGASFALKYFPPGMNLP